MLSHIKDLLVTLNNQKDAFRLPKFYTKSKMLNLQILVTCNLKAIISLLSNVWILHYWILNHFVRSEGNTNLSCIKHDKIPYKSDVFTLAWAKDKNLLNWKLFFSHVPGQKVLQRWFVWRDLSNWQHRFYETIPLQTLSFAAGIFEGSVTNLN